MFEDIFYHFPFMDRSTGENSFRAHFRKAISLELLGCFYLMDAVNPVTELFGGQNIKEKPHIDLSHWFLTFHLWLKTLSFRIFWNVHLC